MVLLKPVLLRHKAARWRALLGSTVAALGTPSSQPEESLNAPMRRSALVAWRANATIGSHQFKWILYGDDDTLFAIDNVLAMVNRFDHNQPYFLADNIWFPEWDGTLPLNPPPVLACEHSPVYSVFT